MSKKNKISKFDMERERFSNFVVDLRPLNKQKNEEIRDQKKIKKENWSINKNIFQNFSKLKKFKHFFNFKYKKIQLNSFFENKKKSLSSNFKKLFRKNNFIFKKEFVNLEKKSENYLLKLIKEQESVFNSSPTPFPLEPSNFQRFFLKLKRTLLKLLKTKNKINRIKEKEKKFESSNKLEKNKENKYRPWLLFILILLLIIFSFEILSFHPLENFRIWQAKITGHSDLAINNLIAATNFASQANFEKANNDLEKASANFLIAADNLKQINNTVLYLASWSKNPKIKLAAESKKLLTAGTLSAELGHNLILAREALFNSKEDNFSNTLDNFLIYGQRSVNESQKLNQVLEEINLNNLPVNYRLKFISLKKQANLLALNLANFINTGSELKEILGLSRDKRYLVVFQNNAELRASGGFIGSYALIDVSKGRIANLEIPGGGSYDTEGGLKVKVTAPQALWLVNPLWHFWDANWWPDWPKTAKNLMWFYEKSGGPSVDGVISLTPTVVENLLKITGPIDMREEYGVIINAENFWQTVQEITEKDNLPKAINKSVKDSNLLTASSSLTYPNIPLEQDLVSNPANKPKKIIGDLSAKILEILPQKLNQENLLKIISIFEESLSSKQILFYFNDPKLETNIINHQWGGEIKKSLRDYLLVVNTNIAGQKSDRVIDQKISEQTNVEADGTIIDTLKITRIHHGQRGVVLTGVRNVDWLRIYVPLGSQLVSVSGFKSPDSKYLQKKPDSDWENIPLLKAEDEAQTDLKTGTKIYQDSGKTVFANWSILDPGQKVVITLKYRLPFNFFSPLKPLSKLEKINSWLNPNFIPPFAYSLMIQKQPGTKSDEFFSTLNFPTKWSIFWRYPKYLTGLKKWKINDQLDSDKYYVILLRRDNNL